MTWIDILNQAIEDRITVAFMHTTHLQVYSLVA